MYDSEVTSLVSVQLLQAHWGFTRMPFGRDLAPSMLHRHHTHAEAMARITWCVEQHHIGVITGEVGAGKTVAIRAAVAALDASRHVSIYIANPAVGVRGLLHHIVAALGAVPSFYTAHPGRPGRRGPSRRTSRTRPHPRPDRSMRPTCSTTPRWKPSGCSPATGMDSGSPMATLLVGQPSLRQKMRLSTLAALEQRIGMRYGLPP